MSEYIIKQYQKGFEEEQAKIGMEVAKSFLAPHQTPVERLRQVYSQENFDPETRLYAFKDNKMIGFLTARILDDDESGIKKASLTLPSVLPEHKEAWKMLYNQTIDVLKKKEVKKIQTWFGCIACKPVEAAEKLGYNKVINDGYFLYNIDVSNVDKEISTDQVIDFNFDKHLELLIPIVVKEYGQTEEWARGVFERLRNDGREDQRIMKVIVKEGELKGFLWMTYNQIDPTIGRVSVIQADNEDYMKQLLALLAKVSEKKGLKQLQVGYTTEDDVKEERYKPIKYDFISSAKQFEKDL